MICGIYFWTSIISSVFFIYFDVGLNVSYTFGTGTYWVWNGMLLIMFNFCHFDWFPFVFVFGNFYCFWPEKQAKTEWNDVVRINEKSQMKWNRLHDTCTTKKNNIFVFFVISLFPLSLFILHRKTSLRTDHIRQIFMLCSIVGKTKRKVETLPSISMLLLVLLTLTSSIWFCFSSRVEILSSV